MTHEQFLSEQYKLLRQVTDDHNHVVALHGYGTAAGDYSMRRAVGYPKNGYGNRPEFNPDIAKECERISGLETQLKIDALWTMLDQHPKDLQFITSQTGNSEWEKRRLEFVDKLAALRAKEKEITAHA